MTGEEEPALIPHESQSSQEDLKSASRVALAMAIGGGVLMLGGVSADINVALGFLHVPVSGFSEAAAGMGFAVLGFWTTKTGLETFLDSWQERRQLEE